MPYILGNRAAESPESTDYPGFHGILDRFLTGFPASSPFNRGMVPASACRTNGTSLSPEAPQTSARTEFCNNTRLADVGFLSSFLESPFYVQFFASLAQYQLYRDAVAATGCFSAILTAGCAGPSDSPPLLTGIG
jgi:hypothetical protein